MFFHGCFSFDRSATNVFRVLVNKVGLSLLRVALTFFLPFPFHLL